MNFMASRQGRFYEDEDQTSGKAKLPFSHSSSSSPSSSSTNHQHKGLVPLTTYQHQHQQQHQRGWLDLDSNQDETTTLRCYNGEAARIELMMDSAHNGNIGGGGDDADEVDDHSIRLGDSSDNPAASVGTMVVEREHMFDKVVTPSDVGKLNRLVIPKQHAERYFPLDSSTNEKGLLLNFEDRNGKPWRFRYSYWNSSQSYVMTKGWSRFVKEKKLDAGDIVSFQRGVGDLNKDRLFIDWRRRPDAPELSPSLPTHPFPFRHSIHSPWNPLFLQPQAAVTPPRDHSHFLQPYNTNHHQFHPWNNGYSYGNSPYSYNNTVQVNPCSGSVIYLRPAGRPAAGAAGPAPQHVGMVQVQRGMDGGGVEVEPVVFDSVPVVHGKAAAKRLRLFGVNMECPISGSDECDILSSTTISHSTMAPQPPHLSSSSSSSIPSVRLRPYNGTTLPTMPSELINKGKASMSLDLDI